MRPGGRDLDQPRRQLGRAGVGEPEHRRVGDAVELLARRRASIAGWRWPWTLHQSEAVAVEVASALAVEQVEALAALDHQRLFLAPALLLGEGVPDVVAIELRVVHRHGPDVSPGGGGSLSDIDHAYPFSVEAKSLARAG